MKKLIFLLFVISTPLFAGEPLFDLLIQLEREVEEIASQPITALLLKYPGSQLVSRDEVFNASTYIICTPHRPGVIVNSRQKAAVILFIFEHTPALYSMDIIPALNKIYGNCQTVPNTPDCLVWVIRA